MKRYPLIFTKSAKNDLIDIWEYILSVSQDLESADALQNKIIAFCKNYLQVFPEMGVRRDFIKENIRFFPVGNFGIYYFFDGEEILVAHILRQSQDIL